MSLATVLLSPQVLGAALLYAVLAILLEVLVLRLHRSVDEHIVVTWGVERVARPLARALAITLFVLAAYPALFGLSEAPSLGELLWSSQGRVNRLVNLAFLVSLLLPLVPVLGSRSALVLPVQGIAVATLMFHWVGAALPQRTVHYWPGWAAVCAVGGLALITPFLARTVARWLGERLDRYTVREGFGPVVYEGLVLLFQLPSILVYTLALGRQLAGGG